jgi:heme A synthase
LRLTLPAWSWVWGGRRGWRVAGEFEWGTTMSGGLTGFHELVGGLVVVAFIVTTILAAIQAAGGNARWTRMAAMVAAALLLLQYILGFALLGSGLQNSPMHYIVALLAIVPVGLQHGSARRLAPRTQGVAMLIWSLAAALLTIIAYMSGMAGVTNVAA